MTIGWVALFLWRMHARPTRRNGVGNPWVSSLALRQNASLACGLTLKWNLARRAETKLDELQAMVDQRTSELRAAKVELEDRVEQRAAELQVALSASESASRAKSEFLANTSHELCSPLHSLLILAQSLASNYEGNPTSTQVQAADVIYQDGQTLLALIKDILDLARLEAGQVKALAEPVDLCLLAGNLRKKFSPLMGKKGLTLKSEVADDLPPTMNSDTQRVEQVLHYLLSNALKFTETGSVTLQINRPGWDTRFMYSELTAENSIAISVTDTGIGIPDDKQTVIFESFQQADGSNTRGYGGTGLGLTISRLFAKLLGGELQVQSRVGEGSIGSTKPFTGADRSRSSLPQGPV